MDPTSRTAAFYYRLPTFAQNLALSAAALRRRKVRFGPSFESHLAMLRESSTWSRDDIDRYQDERVGSLVRHAYETTAYYRRVMDAEGLTPTDIQGRDDLKLLPVLTKEAIRHNHGDLISSAADRSRLVELITSGSTGAPLELLTSRDGIAFKWAVWWRHREWFGMERGDLHLNVMTKPLVSPGQQRPPFWRWNRAERQAMLPMQQVTPEKVAAVVSFLEGTPFRFYSGYPSIIHSLAVHALNRGLTLTNGPEVVFTGAEGVTDQQRADVGALTGAAMAEMYGFNEGAGNASSCSEGNLHEDFEFGYLECVRDDVDDDGRPTGRILATGFSTSAFPLIRYDVGDGATWMPEDYRCPCGRQSRVLASINGRWEDYIVTPAGHQARRLGEIFKEMPTISQFQMRQTDPAAVTLRLVVRDGYSPGDEDTLRARVAYWISHTLDVEFEYVDAIDAAPNGKYQRIVSTLREGSGP